MTTRLVKCAKLNREAPGLDKPPFSGELGQQIFDHVSAEAWNEWKDDMMIKVINEYRLNLVEAEHYNKLLAQMKIFLNLDSGETLEVHNETRGRTE